MKETPTIPCMAIIKIQNYRAKFGDQFFFDTNIWLLIYGPVANYQKKDQKEYSKFLAEIITRNYPIYITSMVISEFGNVILRRDFRQWADNQVNNPSPDFKKDFIGTQDYIGSVQDIKQLIQDILALPIVTKIPDDFNNLDINSILNHFDLVDFNDSYISILAEKKKYKIVTNDKDFQKLKDSVEIITTQV
ncbi:PIN domain-containing protein [Gramella sp. GC03-9]|uniref:PIN domain-containing protein n=1 Tax=Christiangramia oceanisediminis TaxID=2920386 RepID=A0A9X2KYC7_9FLAO|nr:PIN domain-containing protein [Gramella oceanisediminis]MCP9200550.1 PIN domain-containing protein [Gramella oceanisediminis]